VGIIRESIEDPPSESSDFIGGGFGQANTGEATDLGGLLLKLGDKGGKRQYFGRQPFAERGAATKNQLESIADHTVSSLEPLYSLSTVRI
jgi:hypothetical protein